jgi:predicted ester cyclase
MTRGADHGDGQVELGAFRRLIEEGFSGGDPGVVDEVCATDYVEHQAGIDPANREGLKGAIRFLHTLAPDISVEIQDVAVSGDKVWARLRAEGTHRGSPPGRPTGRTLDITVLDVCRFKDGKIVEHWGVADRLTQMDQLGFVAAPRDAGRRLPAPAARAREAG